MAQHMAPCTIPPLSVWPCGTPFGERERVTRRQTSSKRREAQRQKETYTERDIHRDNKIDIHRGRERDIHRRACERDIHRGGV